MSNWKVVRRRLAIAGLCALTLGHSACASRMALVDEKNQPITQEEVAAKKKNKNFMLYTVGGGALSFGASFFIGSMIHRSTNSEDRTALWAITGAGTVVGTALFAHNGKVRDFNHAVEIVKDSRQEGIQENIVKEKQKQDTLAEERKKLDDERKRQEAEREELLKQIRAKQSQEKKPKN